MDALTERYEQLVLEAAMLRKENEALKQNQIQHCRGCISAKLHDCGTLMYCDVNGCIISIDRDGCTWRTAK